MSVLPTEKIISIYLLQPVKDSLSGRIKFGYGKIYFILYDRMHDKGIGMKNY